MPLPNWYLLQAPPNLDIDVLEWKKLAWERVQLLEKLPHNPSQVVRDFFPSYEEDLDQIYGNYRLGAYLLRLVAATNSRLESWLIEAELHLPSEKERSRTISSVSPGIIEPSSIERSFSITPFAGPKTFISELTEANSKKKATNNGILLNKCTLN